MAPKASARSGICVLAMAALLAAGASGRGDQGTNAPTPSAAVVQSAAAARRNMAAADVRWIASKTGWKAASVPRIEVRTSRDLAIMFFGNAEGYEGVRPLALDNLLDQGILLHELVHHMQVSNSIEFDCREETERQAYRLQVAWLREHGGAQPYAFPGIPGS